MGYQLTPLGVSVLALLRERPMRGYEMFQTLMTRREDRIVKVRPRIVAMYLTALDYLLATTRSKLDWLREFADALESGRLGWQPSEVTV